MTSALVLISILILILEQTILYKLYSYTLFSTAPVIKEKFFL